MSEKKEDRKGKPGPKPKQIDWQLFEQLCHIQCTTDELAGMLNVSVDTLYRHAKKHYDEPEFAVIYKRFSEGGRCSLRRAQWKLAQKNTAMAIWLGKQFLGQREPDKEEKQQKPVTIQLVNYSDEAKVTVDGAGS